MSTPEPPFSASPDFSEPRESASPVADAARRGPVLTLADVLMVIVVAVLSTLFFGVLMAVVMFALHMKLTTMSKDLKFILAIQGAGYAATIAFVYRVAVAHHGVPFGEAVCWRWPRRWLGFVGMGALLSVLVQLSLSRLPVPKHLPIDDLFKTAADAWMMTVFGVFIAPFFEELMFRGLLFPALQRYMRTVCAVLITSAGFAVIHADQLGKSWAPVLGIFLVGVVFTLVRHHSKSLAASVLTHMGYNGFLFVVALVQTSGYRHMEKLTQ